MALAATIAIVWLSCCCIRNANSNRLPKASEEVVDAISYTSSASLTDEHFSLLNNDFRDFNEGSFQALLDRYTKATTSSFSNSSKFAAIESNKKDFAGFGDMPIHLLKSLRYILLKDDIKSCEALKMMIKNDTVTMVFLLVCSTLVYSPSQTHFSLVGNIKNAAPLKNGYGNEMLGPNGNSCYSYVIFTEYFRAYQPSSEIHLTDSLKYVQLIAKRLITERRFLSTLLVEKLHRSVG
uniref:Uncharacterized protein n=1 Tax=Glossina austeni TaxID=7395 RepID=A0A1A9UZH2_GLOAU